MPHGKIHKDKEASDFEAATLQIALLLRPLALLAAHNVATEGIETAESFPSMQRDAWYNIVVHGFSSNSLLLRRHVRELKVLARYSRPLIDEDLANRPESDIELNTVLRRGKSADNLRLNEREMIELLPQAEADIKALSYSELMFLRAAYLVETLRASSGQCTQSLEYFVDPNLRHTPAQRSALGNCMQAVALRAVDIYLGKVSPDSVPVFYTAEAAEQLALIFEACCHRVSEVQKVAYLCAERFINKLPSVMCQRTSLFTLLDLLTIMWASCLESETDEYEWSSLHKAPRGDTYLKLSDDYLFRRHTLRIFHGQAKTWLARAINVAALDVKGLLQVSSVLYLQLRRADQTDRRISPSMIATSSSGTSLSDDPSLLRWGRLYLIQTRGSALSNEKTICASAQLLTSCLSILPGRSIDSRIP